MPITAPAIISAPIFAKAQEQLQRNQAKARRAYQPASQRSLLRTLVRCGHCQLHMQATRHRSVCKRYTYLYYCLRLGGAKPHLRVLKHMNYDG